MRWIWVVAILLTAWAKAQTPNTASCQTSFMAIESRYASGTVNAGDLVSSVACAAPVDCVKKNVGTGAIAGIALNDAVDQAPVSIAQSGSAIATFSNTPITDHTTTVNGATAFDTGTSSSAAICNSTGYVGRVLNVVDSTHAWVNLLGPATVGSLVCAGSMDSATMPAYVQSVQNTSTGPTGPTGATGATGSTGATGPAGLTYYSNGTLVSTPVKCNWMTATTAGTGLATFNYSGMGFTSLVGDPQPAIRGTGTTPYLINIQGTPTTTSTTVYASQASIISVVGINVTLIGLAASAPVSLQVCGT